jgi:putative Mn2+ efflux pump MntP
MNQALLIYGIPFLLSMDVFFLSISGGVTQQPYKWVNSLKISLAFSFSQLLAGGLGLLIAKLIFPLITDFSAMAGSLLVAFFGSKMLQEAVKVKNEQRTFLIEDKEILLPLALASSLNTFVIFVGLGFLMVPFIPSLSALIASIFFLSLIGQFIGSHYRPLRLGRSSKFAGGLLIILFIILNYVL